MSTRNVKELFVSKRTREGAGVMLQRAFGAPEVPKFDPFLLLDEFGSDDPKDYLAGFPWHPHRGIETVTYMIEGEVDHEDSLGNKGTIRNGDVQWMTAGSGIIHQEMPQKYDGVSKGFQLWVNLPKSAKMTGPKYRDITKDDIPVVKDEGCEVRIVAGTYNGKTGPVTDLAVPVIYFDLMLQKKAVFSHTIPVAYTAFIYVYEGSVKIGDTPEEVGRGIAILTDNGTEVRVEAKENARFIFVSGEPLNESVAWYGPIVMNTQDELNVALQELQNGTFIKSNGTESPEK